MKTFEGNFRRVRGYGSESRSGGSEGASSDEQDHPPSPSSTLFDSPAPKLHTRNLKWKVTCVGCPHGHVHVAMVFYTSAT